MNEDTVTAIGLDLLPCAYCWRRCSPTSAARTRPGNALSLQRDGARVQKLPEDAAHSQERTMLLLLPQGK